MRRDALGRCWREGAAGRAAGWGRPEPEAAARGSKSQSRDEGAGNHGGECRGARRAAEAGARARLRCGDSEGPAGARPRGPEPEGFGGPAGGKQELWHGLAGIVRRAPCLGTGMGFR